MEQVRQAYAARAEEYIDKLGSMEATAPTDRDLIAGWGTCVTGPVLDLGAGPGHWTAHLHGLGVEIAGVDPVTEFVADARRRFPGVDFQVGGVVDLAPDGNLGGILAWYSLIHLPPDQLDAALLHCFRALRPGGSLLLGHFAADELAPFDHAVVTAYAWPLPWIAQRVAEAGFQVVEQHTRQGPGSRRHGDLAAVRP
ncbi:class I SAM-dependent methyltransferase [Parenemella sanctibonifatiensis]|uniref:SAM-dependent methyltransferase n=1 Tax=Parenemella sanctibonifatiensis TaxID=2016505 RepID=A0A255EX62_9ACTN|nr:class I SAM-dependent methyltransferase [Parenemella sanctibonifatiensis]OYN92723.1 SAM-dependent methyltransferase [Parenemella sanctibonifatiensis]